MLGAIAAAYGARHTLVRRVAIGVVAVPAIMLGLAGGAQAAEITPIAEYLDETVAATSDDIISIVTALLT